jgi:riboflavin kinase/FMN adenylyltransferase
MSANVRESAVVIGNFDGVHRGHQAVLAALLAVAGERGLTPRVLTFEPHPAATLGRTPPPLLTRIERKVELLTRACPGVEVVVREFTRAFSEQSARAFVEDVLVGELGARAVMVGQNFRFGRGREGGLEELAAFGREHGFELLAEPLVSDAMGPLSSTRVRERLAAGDLEGAAALLGRPHLVSGTVEHGHKRGRTLGFPTCNVRAIDEALPPDGVYAVLVDVALEGKARALGRGVANLGVRPTLSGEGARLLEVHVFDFAGELYGASLRVHLVRRLREERRFAGLDALKEQIARDADDARQALAGAVVDVTLGAWG